MGPLFPKRLFITVVWNFSWTICSIQCSIQYFFFVSIAITTAFQPLAEQVFLKPKLIFMSSSGNVSTSLELINFPFDYFFFFVFSFFFCRLFHFSRDFVMPGSEAEMERKNGTRELEKIARN